MYEAMKPAALLDTRITRRRFLAGLVALGLVPAAARRVWAALSDDQRALLEKSEFVYISSTRKDGNLGEPAEIWFFMHEGDLFVGTSPESWRVKRIGWGRPQAKIWIGKRDGPSYRAVGSIEKDPAIQAKLLEAFAKKYPKGWVRWEKNFREGFADGSRVLVRYRAVD